MGTKRRMSAFAVSAIAAMTIAACGFAQVLSANVVRKSVAEHALIETKEYSENQAEQFRHSLDLQFDTMESLSRYLGEYEKYEFSEVQDLMRSFLTVNKFCAVAYTDIKGNILGAVSADSAVPSGNVSEREYFKDAIYWKDARAIQYMQKTALTDTPRVLFAVPIVHKNVITGCLFASTEQDFFEEKIFGVDASGDVTTYLMDGEGTILADCANTGLFQNGFNVFDSYLSEADSEAIYQDVAASVNRTITINPKNPTFLSYTTTGINDWMMVSQMDYPTAKSRYVYYADMSQRMVWGITAIFFAGALGLMMIWSGMLHKQVNLLDKLTDRNRKMKGFLKKSGNASFSFDARNVTLHVSPELEEMLEHKVPENWFSEVSERKKLHPEFDYDGIIQAYNDIIITGEYRELCTCINLKDERTRWLKFAMSPSFDGLGRNCGVVGIVTDISEAYINENLSKEEHSHLLEATLSYIPITVSINLTQRSYTLLNYVPSYFQGLPEKGNYAELVAYASEHIPETYREMFLQRLNRKNLLDEHACGKRILEFEHPYIVEPEHSEKWVVSKISFLNNGVNDELRMLLMMVDNTSQKAHELLVQKNCDIIIDNMPGFACKWVFTEDDILLDEANRSYYRFLKVDENQVHNHSIFYGMNEEEKKKLFTELSKLKVQKKDIHTSFRGVKYDGQEYYIMVNGTYSSLSEDKETYICVLTDITSIVKMREGQKQKAEELQLAAELSKTLVLKYDIQNRKIYVLADGAQEMRLSQLDGHAPEYAVESGLVPIVDGTSFYSAFKAIEKGSEEGELGFAFNQNGVKCWVNGLYKTVLDEMSKPIYAIILLSDEAKPETEGTDSGVSDFYEFSNKKAVAMMVVNLTQDSIEFESEMEDYSLTQAGIFGFADAKKRMLADGRIAERSQLEWMRFFNTKRLVKEFQEGKTSDHITFYAANRFGTEREVEVKLLLQDNSYDGNIRAYIVFKDAKANENSAISEPEGEEVASVTDGQAKRNIFIHTFGYFDVYIDGKPISFTHEKSKEMLAVLVDRKGGFVSSSEMIGYLWEYEPFNKTTQARCRQVASRLKKTLEENGIGDIIETVNGQRRIIPEKVDCDYFNYLGNKPEFRHLFNGTYMMNYSWSEMTTAELENSKSRI